MLYKQINLLLLGILMIVLILQIPVYDKWFHSKILSGVSLDYQLNHMGFDERMGYRFGIPFSVYKAVQHTLENSKAVNPVVLLPPNGYIKAMKPENEFNIVEPAIFYYFTGFKAVTINSPELERADWVMIIENRKVGLRRIADTNYLHQLVTDFKKYK